MDNMKKALIIGATGMDGSLMVDLLLSKGYFVYATFYSKVNLKEHENLKWFFFDLSDENLVFSLLSIHVHESIDEVYNFGGVSFSPDSIRMPSYTMDVNYRSVMRLLAWVEYKKCKFFQASSSEVFGKVKNLTLNENSPRNPHTPYAHAKNLVDMMLRYMREQGYPVYNAISFNHECNLRGEQFVTKKITKFVADIINHKRVGKLKLGNINSKRDWGYAPDFIEGYYKMMQGEPQELIFATAQTHSVLDILNIAFSSQGLNWEDYVTIDSELVREDERDNLLGDYSKAWQTIQWCPKKHFDEMIIEMVELEKNK
jgi:GDPmannose 4,6-dehydratase